MTDAPAPDAAAPSRLSVAGPDAVLRWIDTLNGWQLAAAVALAPVVGGLLISGLMWLMLLLDWPIFGTSRPDFLVARATAAGGAKPVFQPRALPARPAVPKLTGTQACDVRLVGPMLALDGCAEGGPASGPWPLAGVRWPALGSEAEKRAMAALQGLVPAAARLDCAQLDGGVTCRAHGVWLDEALLASGLAFPERTARARALAWPAMASRRGVWWDGLAMKTPPSAMVAWRSMADASAGMAEATAQAGVGLRTAFMMAVMSGVLTGLGVLLGLRHQRSEVQQKLDREDKERQERLRRLRVRVEALPAQLFKTVPGKDKTLKFVRPDKEEFTKAIEGLKASREQAGRLLELVDEDRLEEIEKLLKGWETDGILSPENAHGSLMRAIIKLYPDFSGGEAQADG